MVRRATRSVDDKGALADRKKYRAVRNAPSKQCDNIFDRNAKKIKQSKINEHKIPLDEILHDQFCVEVNMDKNLEKQNLRGEMIENPKLYEAMKSLSIEDQVLLSYMVKKGKSRRELSLIYGLAQKYK